MGHPQLWEVKGAPPASCQIILNTHRAKVNLEGKADETEYMVCIDGVVDYGSLSLTNISRCLELNERRLLAYNCAAY